MVKRNWDTEELIENWTLLPQELELVKNKVVTLILILRGVLQESIVRKFVVYSTLELPLLLIQNR
jgi:hypothetical protein